MLSETSTSRIEREYEIRSQLFAVQPAATRLFLEQQAGLIFGALEQGRRRIRFQLPEMVLLEGGEALQVPPRPRRQVVGTLLGPAGRADLRLRLARHLLRMEAGFNPGLSACGKLLQYALAQRILHGVLPVGDPHWKAGETSSLSAAVEQAEKQVSANRAAFQALQDAEAFCPGVAADGTYQHKRACLLEQFTAQGCALANLYAHRIISRLQERATLGSLNRGLSLDLPYFDLADMSIHLRPLEVIPGGRLLFAPASLFQAIRMARMEIGQDLRLNLSARRQVLDLLAGIEAAFGGPSPELAATAAALDGQAPQFTHTQSALEGRSSR